MSDPRFIFETVDFQNGAATINNYVENYNAVNNAAATGNTFKFRSDYDRMKNLLGSSGQSRTSGYYDGLYSTYYTITVTSPTLPSSNGPGSSGWGPQKATGPLSVVRINDAVLQEKTGQSEYVGVVVSGYLYSPRATTVTLQTTTTDGIVVYFNGAKVIDNWTYHTTTTDTSSVLAVNAGYNPITMLYFEGTLVSQFDFVYTLNGTAPTGLLKCNFVYNYNQM